MNVMLWCVFHACCSGKAIGIALCECVFVDLGRSIQLSSMTCSTSSWVGLAAGLDVVVKRKISCFCRNLKREPNSPWSSSYTDYATPVRHHKQIKILEN